MDLMLNEISVEGQFFNHSELREAIRKVMAMRSEAMKSKVEVYCHWNVSNIEVTPGELLGPKFHRVLSDKDEQRSFFRWIDRGPFSPRDDSGGSYEHDGYDVTEKGLADAAYWRANGIDRRMVSFASSSWKRSPLTVTHSGMSIDIPNYWDMSALKPHLEQAFIAAVKKLKTWKAFEEICRSRFTSLHFAADSFHPLNGQQFAPGVADRIRERLDVLNCIQASGGRGSTEGRRLYDKHFIGDRAWFSDSSDSEKRDFESKLTFNVGGEATLCGWHGKINTPPYRIHFTWPVPSGEQLHVVYLGLKITRQ